MGDPEVSIDQLADRLRAAVEAFEVYCRGAAQSLGLAVEEAQVITQLGQRAGSPTTLSVLAMRLGMPATNVTALVERLELIGLVAGHRDPSHGGEVFVELTDAGDEASRSLVETCSADLLVGVGEANPHHIAELKRTLEHVTTHLQARAREGITATMNSSLTPSRDTVSQPRGRQWPILPAGSEHCG